jgi:hypothetical protein
MVLFVCKNAGKDGDPTSPRLRVRKPIGGCKAQE